MTLAPPVFQPAEAMSNDHADCGKLTGRAIVQRLTGQFWAMDGIPDNANAEQIAAGIRSVPGVHAVVSWGSVASLQATQYDQGHYLVIGVNCTSWAVPVPYDTGIRHWLGAYAPDRDYNCWEATLESDDLAGCHNPGMGTVIVWMDAPVPAPPPLPPGEREMRAFTLDGYQCFAWVGDDGSGWVYDLALYDDPSPAHRWAKGQWVGSRIVAPGTLKPGQTPDFSPGPVPTLGMLSTGGVGFLYEHVGGAWRPVGAVTA